VIDLSWCSRSAVSVERGKVFGAYTFPEVLIVRDALSNKGAVVLLLRSLGSDGAVCAREASGCVGRQMEGDGIGTGRC